MAYKRLPTIIAPMTAMCTYQIATNFLSPFTRFLLCNSCPCYIGFLVTHEHYSAGRVFNFDSVAMPIQPVPHLPSNY